MKKNYVPAIDGMRVMAILMVILIHTTSKTLGANSNEIMSMPITFLLNQITRGAVAIFIMISGFVLEQGYDGQPALFYKKRFIKILLPYFFWSLVYYYFIYAPNPTDLWLVLLGGGAAYQLYFIPSLLILYLLFPILRQMREVMALALGIVQIGLLYWDYSVKPLPPELGPINIVLLNYLVFWIGIVAARNQEKILSLVGRYKIYFIAMSLMSGLYVWVEGLGGYLMTGNYLTFYSQRRVSILLYTVFLMSTLFYFWKNGIFVEITKKMSELSFFVFFVHLIFLEWIWNNWPMIHRPEYGLLFFVMITSLSFGSAFVVHKIKPLIKVCG